AGAELAVDPGAAGPDAGTRGGWADHHLCRLALDLPDQHPDGTAGDLAGVALHPAAEAAGEAAGLARVLAFGKRAGAGHVRLFHPRPAPGQRAAGGGRATGRPRPAGRVRLALAAPPASADRPAAAEAGDLPYRRDRRLAVP